MPPSRWFWCMPRHTRVQNKIQIPALENPLWVNKLLFSRSSKLSPCFLYSQPARPWEKKLRVLQCHLGNLCFPDKNEDDTAVKLFPFFLFWTQIRWQVWQQPSCNHDGLVRRTVEMSDMTAGGSLIQLQQHVTELIFKRNNSFQSHSKWIFYYYSSVQS